jgi:hypothetical protein
MTSFKHLILVGLATSWSVGQDFTVDGLQSDAAESTSPHRTLATAAGETTQHHTLSFDDVFKIYRPMPEGTYQENGNSKVIVFSITDAKAQETRFAVNKDLVLKYSNFIRYLYSGDAIAFDSGESILREAVPLINHYNPLYFQLLLKLLFTYDQDPITYQKGRCFDMDSPTVCGVLNLANFLFSRNEIMREGLVVSNDLGFFHALLKSGAHYIFKSSSVENLPTEDGRLVLPLPYDIYRESLPFAAAHEVYKFGQALQSFEMGILNNDTHLLLKNLNTYFTIQKKCLAWRGIKVTRDVSEIAERSRTILNSEFIEWTDITPVQPVNQSYIVVSPFRIWDEAPAIDRWFAQNPDKTLIVDFGMALTIGDRFFCSPKHTPSCDCEASWMHHNN